MGKIDGLIITIGVRITGVEGRVKSHAKPCAGQTHGLNRHQRHAESQGKTRGQDGRFLVFTEEWDLFSALYTPVSDDNR